MPDDDNGYYGGAGGAASVTPITAGRTEAQIAADYRARTLELLEQLVNVITEARKDHSLTISFSISPPDAFGRCSIGMLEISKKLC
jgi:hypothetical protein